VVGELVTAYPEGADKEDIASPVIVVRVRPEELDLPEERRAWAPGGLIAYSKICTHAGCAVSEYRYPSYAPTSPGPAVVCPCHYSTFSVTEGGKRIFGPAGRALPQLPLEVDAGGNLVAAGDFSGRPGPSWWGVRQ
jgi:ubiquinol-cytochrome c reductase iron-sulfur subunit